MLLRAYIFVFSLIVASRTRLKWLSSSSKNEGASLLPQLIRNLPAMQETPVWFPGSGRSPGRGIGYPLVFLGFPGGSDGKESACNVGDLGSVPGLGRARGGGLGNPLQYSCLENPRGQRSLAGYSPRSWKELDMTYKLDKHSTEKMKYPYLWPTGSGFRDLILRIQA